MSPLRFFANYLPYTLDSQIYSEATLFLLIFFFFYIFLTCFPQILIEFHYEPYDADVKMRLVLLYRGYLLGKVYQSDHRKLSNTFRESLFEPISGSY